jgi:hypothetical protein
VVTGPTGRFCSAGCKEKHQAFAQRAQQYDSKARAAYFVRLRGLIGTIVVAVALLAALGILSSFVYIPVLSNLTEMARARLGL